MPALSEPPKEKPSRPASRPVSRPASTVRRRARPRIGAKLHGLRLVRELAPLGDVQTFHAVREDDPGKEKVLARIRVVDDKTAARRRELDASGSDTVRLHAEDRDDPFETLRELLERRVHPALPELRGCHAGDLDLMVESIVHGTPLMEAWRGPGVGERERTQWLAEVAGLLDALHRHEAIFPALAPSRLVVDGRGAVRVRDALGIVRAPLPNDRNPWKALWHAPELADAGNAAPANADAYHFGALAYALYLGRELRPEDFQADGEPIPITRAWPDAPPPLVRLLAKSFVRHPAQRFPTPGCRFEHPTGLHEIRGALAELARCGEHIAYDIAAWSTSGLVRGNNEDCFTVSQVRSGAADGRQEVALACLADGMGGLAHGEVAAARAVSVVADALRRNGLSSARLEQVNAAHPFEDAEGVAKLVAAAIAEANEAVYQHSQALAQRSQMGCTLEVLLLMGRHATLGHVGDSRVYHATGERIRQATIDQTVVQRMIDRGELTPETAKQHPYRSAVTQAIGANPTVEPELMRFAVAPGDWLLVCSDGITNHLDENDLHRMLLDSKDAEQAARRLVNLANVRGGSDNATVVVIRAR